MAQRSKRAEAEARGAARRVKRVATEARSAARVSQRAPEARGEADRNERVAKELEAKPLRIEGEPLKPIRKVMREIVRPDGTILRVEVPVYPPFKLKERGEPKD